MYRLVLFAVASVTLVGCGASSQSETSDIKRLDPSDQQSAAATAERVPATSKDVEMVLDLPEYPGAEIVENARLVSPSFSPDEARFDLVRRTKDAPAKVVAYYEHKLKTESKGNGGHQEILGRTERGNFVIVHIDGEGTGTKYTLKVISYAK